MGIEIVEKIEDEGDIWVGGQNWPDSGPWWAPENFPRPDPIVYTPPPPPLPVWVDIVAGGGISTIFGQQDFRRPTLEDFMVVAAPPPMVQPGPVTTVAGPEESEMSITITGSGGGNMSGSILGTITNAIVDLGTQYLMAQAAPQSFVAETATAYLVNQTMGAPTVSGTASGSAQATVPKGHLWDPVKGRWVKCRRRRRKRLATMSDIKDLSSLKGVLGAGKAFDLWIATHSR